MAAGLDHPNIVPIYRVAQAGGIHYIVMKFVEGRPLDAIVEAQGALPLPVVVAVLRAAASALAYAHELGTVHRDIKSSNILVDQEGRVYVSDFGLARASDGEGSRPPLHCRIRPGCRARGAALFRLRAVQCQGVAAPPGARLPRAHCAYGRPPTPPGRSPVGSRCAHATTEPGACQAGRALAAPDAGARGGSRFDGLGRVVGRAGGEVASADRAGNARGRG